MLMRPIHFLWFCGSFILSFAVSGRSADVEELPLFVIPRMAKAPLIDGKNDHAGWPQSEWDMAVPLMGFTLARQPSAPTVLPLARVGYDSKALYICVSAHHMDGTGIKCASRERDTAEWKDDSVEVHLGVGENPKITYQFVVNADNAVFDATNEGSNCDKKWNAEWEHGATKRGDGWDMEMAIPWKAIGLDAPTAEQVLRINIGFNYHVQGAGDVENSSWGPVLDEKGKCWGYSALERMPVARLGGEGVAVGATLMISKSGAPELRLQAVNCSPEPLKVEYCIQPPFWNPLDVPGEKWAATSPLSIKPNQDGLGEQPVQVKGADGELVLRQVVRFRSRFTSAVSLRKYYPNHALEIVTEGLPDGAKAFVEVKDQAGGVVSQHTAELGDGKSPRIRLDISAWKENAPHVLTVKLNDQDGASLGAREFSAARPAVPAWLGTRAGLADEPLPPFTAIQVQDKTLRCLQTSYEFSKQALPAQIQATGQPLLAAPVRLIGVQSGKEFDVADTPIRITSQKVNRVEWTAEKNDRNLSFRLMGWMEEDGFVWCELTATGKGALDSLALIVPLRNECVKWVNAAAPLSDARENAFAFNGQPWRAGEFYTMINLLNEDRGLTVMAPDPRAWSNENEQSRQMMERKKDGAAVLSFVFIDKPTVLGRPRTYEFGFQAMPAKPVPKNARLQRRIHDVQYGHEVSASKIPGMTMVEYAASLGAKTLINHSRWTEDYGSPRTVEKAANLKALTTACHRHGMRHILYLGYGLGAYTPESQLYEDYWRREPIHVWAGPAREFFRAWCNKTNYVTDFILDGVAQTLKEYSVDGFYYDGTTTGGGCINPQHGCGWTDSEGTVHATVPLLENRRFAKRLYAIAKQHDPNSWIDWHSSGQMSAWAAAWSDSTFSGEQFMDALRDGQINFDEVCAQYMAPAYGTVTDYIWLAKSYGVLLDLKQQMACPLLLNSEPRGMLWKEDFMSLIAELWRVKDRFDVNDTEWIPFTKAADFLRVSGGKSYASLYLVKGTRALIVVSNLQVQGAEVALQLDLTRLGLKGRCKDAIKDLPLASSKGRLNLALGPYDWKLIEVN